MSSDDDNLWPPFKKMEYSITRDGSSSSLNSDSEQSNISNDGRANPINSTLDVNNIISNYLTPATPISILDCILWILNQKYFLSGAFDGYFRWHQFDVNNRIDKEGNTLLHLCVLKNHEEAIKILLNHKANKRILNRDNKTPLQLALGQDPVNENIVALL